MMLCAVVAATGLMAAPAAANANQATWYAQGSTGWCYNNANLDCFSLATGTSTWNGLVDNNTTYPNFVPYGDCSQSGCPGGYAGPPRTSGDPQGWVPIWGTWCTDYSTGGNRDTNCAIGSQPGTWTLHAGSAFGDTCFCGVHLIPDFTPTYQASSDYPWSYGNGSNFLMGSTTQETTTGGHSPYWAGYECFDLNNKNYPNGGSSTWIEDCQSDWSGNSWPGWGNQTICNSSGFASVDNLFTSSGQSQSYGTNHGYSFNGNQGTAHAYAFGTSYSQIQAALNQIAQNPQCSNWDTNPADYYITQLEFGTEGGDNYGSAASVGERNAYAYTTY